MAKSISIVYYEGQRRGKSQILKITPDKKYAMEFAEGWAIDNGGLRCQIVEIAVLSTEEYPKKEKENG